MLDICPLSYEFYPVNLCTRVLQNIPIDLMHKSFNELDIRYVMNLMLSAKMSWGCLALSLPFSVFKGALSWYTFIVTPKSHI